MLKNRELAQGLGIYAIGALILTAAGFSHTPVTGLLVLAACALGMAMYLLTEQHRYRRLQRLSRDLSGLLLHGTQLPISEYTEGELSILANQIQKLTLRLTEAAETVKTDKLHLADSLADISHQLRTPLTAMNLTVSMLSAPELAPQRRQELIQELRSLLHRTDWLVETLLKLSKLDAGAVTMSPAQIPAEALIARAAQGVAIPMDIRAQKLLVRSNDVRLSCDPVWTAEALGNILKNCMEHTPVGGTVTVTALDTALFTQITVEDTGPGFDPADIPHLFERFYKGSNAGEGSYGIGLNLARTVAAAQNGTIQAMNGSQGARFVLKFYKQII